MLLTNVIERSTERLRFKGCFKEGIIYFMDSTITKRKSLILKCIAVSLMVCFHTFGFPNRIGGETYISIGNFNGKNIELMIANFGSICVGMFLFLSGYGLYQTYNKNINYKGIINRIFKLYLNFWSVFIIFISLAILLGKYQFNIRTFLLNFFSLSSSYNAEWWFLRLYFMLVLLYPIIIHLLCKYSIKKVVLLSFMLNIFGLTTTKLSYVFGVSSLLIDCFNILLGGQFLFVLGVGVSKNGIFDLIRNKVHWNSKIYTVILIFYTPIMATLIDLPVIGEILKLILIPIFIFLIANIIATCKFMEWIGKHSTNIWLTHSFFCYYLFPKIVFYPQYSILVFIWIMSLSLGSSYIVNMVMYNVKKLSLDFKLRKLSTLK